MDKHTKNLVKAGNGLYAALQLALSLLGDAETDMGTALVIVGAKESWNKAKEEAA